MKESYEKIHEELSELDSFLTAECSQQCSEMVNHNNFLVRVDKSSYMRKVYCNEAEKNANQAILNIEKSGYLAVEREKESDLSTKKNLVDKFETLLNMM